ncbi:extracellular protein [Colletotrichum truncatum]|uniref:Extracellular protein n=1 Tax=Colletotrichum truncatum TaxID=5467 RepID=A0ACC3Z950_COLTU|nr:extracellular protein [Colletotrichum truncatum]KAF6793539.1 extracellular protein [Colletotrichum truncatum]
MKSVILLAVALLASQVSSHMAMTYPPPLRSKENPFSTPDVIDYSITSPMSASGSDFPCKGTLNLLGSPAARPVATWQAGKDYNMTIAGGANHNGGSCQAALSYDSGKTFTVIHSYIGNCPPPGTSTFKFTLPADVPSAQEAIFAWTWFNNVGNREFYMNCAVVTVNGGAGAATSGQTNSVSFSSRPQIFKANINNGCTTAEGSDVAFPNPGPDFDSTSSKTAPPSGNCGAVAPNPGTGGGSGGGSAVPSNSPVPSSSPALSSNPVASVPSSSPVADQPSSVPSVSPVSQDLSQPAPIPTRATGGSAPATSLPGGVFIPISSSTSVSCYPEIETQTTLATISRPSPTNASASTSPSPTDIAPVPTPTAKPPGGDDAPGAMKPGLACTEEGQWLCIAGTHFQRCASGRWSVIMSMAAGTKCQSGTTEFVTWAKKRAHKRAHSGRLRARSKHV